MTHQGTNLPPRYDIKGVCHTFAGEWEGQLVAQPVKNLPAMQETWIQPLGQEDPLEKGMAAHSSILVWRIPQRSLAGSSPWGRKEPDTTERLTLSAFSNTFVGHDSQGPTSPSRAG